MCPGFLSLAALLLPLWLRLTGGTPVIQDVFEATSVSGSDCVLQCTAKPKPGVQYLAVRWYKVRQPLSRLSGLLTKDLPNGETRFYTGQEREVELHGSHDIFLPNMTCGDRGLYVCHLAAPVGEQNRDGYVRLTLTDCPDSPTENLMSDTYMVVVATAVLILALVTFPISYVCLRNTLRDRNKKQVTKEILLDAPLKPLDKKDLMLIYTLGPKTTPTMKHFCV